MDEGDGIDNQRTGWSSERRRKFMATMAAKGRRVGRPKNLGGGKPRTTLPAVIETRMAGTVASSIDEAIASLEEDKAALQRAKEILQRS